MSSHVAPGEESAYGLDRRAELREFLRTRRARIQPEELGLPSYGRRRVPGLRREELAQLAGVSFAYYARLEQGYADNMSPEVMDAVAHALRLSEDERAHLIRLAQPRRQTTEHDESQRLRPTVQHLLDALGVPAYVVGRRMDILGWNRLAAALFGDWTHLPSEERNWARLIFLSPTTRACFADPGLMAQGIVSVLRVDAGAHPDDVRLASLVKELSEKSEEFRRLWARHDVRCKNDGTLRLRDSLMGEFELSQETMSLSDDIVQLLVTYHAEPGTRSEETLRMLASWGTPPRR